MPKRLIAVAVVLLISLASMALWLGRGDSVTLPAAKSAVFADVNLVSPGAIYSAKFSDHLGNQQSLGQWENKLLIVNFWATWCAPCKEEIPILVRLQEKFGTNGIQIIGIAVDSRVKVVNFAKKANINYPLLPDEGGAIELSKRLGNRLGLLPHTAIFTPGGALIYTKLGIISEVELSDIIMKNMPIKR